jgi:Immunoglobulin I-set domain.
MLWIPHQLVGAPLAYSVTLECFTEAHPTSLNYWTREDGHMIHESRKYRAENTVDSPPYKTHMKLTINNIQERDYGTYKCVAKNPRGETDGTIRLYSEYTSWIFEYSVNILRTDWRSMFRHGNYQFQFRGQILLHVLKEAVNEVTI